MSGSAALEYGFPSTHSTNAVSVAFYAFHVLGSEKASSLDPDTIMWAQILCWLYACSIGLGRLYCGMHGFIDVVAGGVLGALISLLHIRYGEEAYQWLIAGSLYRPFLVGLILIAIVRTHPEPADNCPCFDDSVAFSGVVIGCSLASWRMAIPSALPRLVLPTELDFSYGVPFLSLKTLARIPLGVVIIVAWRATTKPILLKALPPIFRVMEHLDLDLPRKYFLKASQYRTVPRLRRDDNVLPSASEMGRMLGDVRKRRGRAISVGPQSVADAYEVIAYEEAKRQSRSNSAARAEDWKRRGPESPVREANTTAGAERDGEPLSRLNSAASARPGNAQTEKSIAEETEREEERQAIFSSLPHGRVRYDVEVITKLIVYIGIAWWALEGCLFVFELIGIGIDI
jgi:hypothetical protein